jgi:EAL domain-containing protein (putative c-di-GMP-specific phosphodiesterase class I)
MTDTYGRRPLGTDAECPGIHDRKVLVIEDSWTQRAHAVAVVKSLGAAEVLEAGDGIEALEIIDRDDEIDLILCDLEMPRMDGVALIGEIAARELNPHILILSSLEPGVLESVRLMAQSYGLPYSGVLPKPLCRQGLIDLLAAPPFTEDLARASFCAAGPGILSLKEIQRGLEGGEFECFFQPQVAMGDGRMKGVEALVRWRHPELGVLTPAHFLPRMEEDPETMSSLTLRILEDAAQKRASWKEDGVEPDFSVNLSAASLGTPGFADRILETVARHAIKPSSMIFEVTESASISNMGHTLSNLTRLRMRGFKLSIDDFGTGYATYEQLERIPFTELKIDMSITRDLPKSRKHAILAKSLLRLARELRLHTVAEGIETQESWNVLKSYGCDCGQGYFLARPMPADQIKGWTQQERNHLARAPRPAMAATDALA